MTSDHTLSRPTTNSISQSSPNRRDKRSGTDPLGLGAVSELVLGDAAGGDTQPPAALSAPVADAVEVDAVRGQTLDDAQVPVERRRRGQTQRRGAEADGGVARSVTLHT